MLPFQADCDSKHYSYCQHVIAMKLVLLTAVIDKLQPADHILSRLDSVRTFWVSHSFSGGSPGNSVSNGIITIQAAKPCNTMRLTCCYTVGKLKLNP